MPLKRDAGQREPQLSLEQEEAEARPARPAPEVSAAVRGAGRGRPHAAFVEERLRQYLQDGDIRSLVKPSRDEIRAAAIRVLGRKLRERPGEKLNPYLGIAHHAVANVVEHAREQHWTSRPLTDPYASANYVEALVQLAADADWLARELRIPEHPSICYTRDAATGKPVPRDDDYIRGRYLSEAFGPRLTKNSRIYPFTSRKRGPVFYTLYDKDGIPSVKIHYCQYGGESLYSFSGVSYHVKELEVLRAANNEIAALKRSDPGWKEQVTRLYKIRKPLGLL